MVTAALEHVAAPIEERCAATEARLVPFRPQVRRHILAVTDQALAQELIQGTYQPSSLLESALERSELPERQRRAEEAS